MPLYEVLIQRTDREISDPVMIRADNRRMAVEFVREMYGERVARVIHAARQTERSAHDR